MFGKVFALVLAVAIVFVHSYSYPPISGQNCADEDCSVNCTQYTLPTDPFCQGGSAFVCYPNEIIMDLTVYDNAVCSKSSPALLLLDVKLILKCFHFRLIERVFLLDDL